MARAETRTIAKAQKRYALQSASSLPDCGHGFVTLLNPDLGAINIVPLRCHKWSCPFCAPIRLRKLQDKARRGHPERHIVLTLTPGLYDNLPDYVTFLRKKFRSLIQKIRREFGTLEYMAVVELQKSGVPHLHVLTRGTYIPWRWLTGAWQKLTGAWHVHISSITRTSNAIVELTKYLAKTAASLAEHSLAQAMVTTSAKWLIDKEETDPSYAEHDWLTHFCRIPVHNLQKALALLNQELTPPDKVAPGWTLKPHPPPTEAEVAAAVGDCPDSIYEALHFAIAMCRGTDAILEYFERQDMSYEH